MSTMDIDENSMESVDIETRSTPSPADRGCGSVSPPVAVDASPGSSRSTPGPSSSPGHQEHSPTNSGKLSFGISRILSDDMGTSEKPHHSDTPHSAHPRDLMAHPMAYSARIFGAPYPVVLGRASSPEAGESPGLIRVPIHRPVPFSPHPHNVPNPHSPGFSPLMFPWMQDRKDRLTGEAITGSSFSFIQFIS